MIAFSRVKTILVNSRVRFKHLHFFLSFLRFYLCTFREGREGEERDRNMNVLLPLVHPRLGAWPAPQACALTGNWTSNPLVCRPALNPLSHTSQGKTSAFLSPGVMFFLACHVPLLSTENKKEMAIILDPLMEILKVPVINLVFLKFYYTSRFENIVWTNCFFKCHKFLKTEIRVTFMLIFETQKPYSSGDGVHQRLL